MGANECFQCWCVYLQYQLALNVVSVASLVRPRGYALLVGNASQERAGVGSSSRGSNRRCLNRGLAKCTRLLGLDNGSLTAGKEF